MKGGALLQRQSALLALRDDGLRQRVLGFDFDGGDELQQGASGSLRKFTTRASTITSVTRGFPSVSVPVLSRATTLTVAALSRHAMPGRAADRG